MSQRRLHEVVRGPHACLFLPTPPSHLLLFKSVKKQNLRQGRGTDICREDQTERENCEGETVQHCRLLPYRPPERWGNDQKHFLKDKETQIRELRLPSVDLQHFFLFVKNMADNVLESGPPSAKRPKLSSPALSASDGNGKYKCMLFLVSWRYKT